MYFFLRREILLLLFIKNFKSNIGKERVERGNIWSSGGRGRGRGRIWYIYRKRLILLSYIFEVCYSFSFYFDEG